MKGEGLKEERVLCRSMLVFSTKVIFWQLLRITLEFTVFMGRASQVR